MADADPTAAMAAVQPHAEGVVEGMRALIEKADPLPWHERDGYYREIQASPWAANEYGPMVTTLTGQIAAQQGRGKHNVALIVAAVNAFPELLDHLAACHHRLAARPAGGEKAKLTPRDTHAIARQMLADRGRFPSGGDVPFDVAMALISQAIGGA